MKIKLLPLLILLISGTGCIQEETPVPEEETPQYGLSLAAPMPATRSAIFDLYGVEETALGACKAAIYLGGIKIREVESDGGTLSLGTLNTTTKYSFYAVTGAVADGFTFPDEESAIPSLTVSFKAGSSTFNAFMSTWKTIPSIACAKDISPSTLDARDGTTDRKLTLEAVRLFAKVNLTVEADEKILELCPQQRLSSLKIRNAAAASPLFGSSLSWKSVPVWSTGDREDDGLVFGQTYSLYLPENLQGIIGADNLLPSRKSADVLGQTLSSSRLSRLTYIETSAQYSIGNVNAGDGGAVTYRFYPGGNDCNDFDIRRNTVYNITLRLTYDNMFSGGDWKIDTEGITDSRSLSFTSASTIHAPGKKTYFAASYEDAYTQRESHLHPQFSYMYRHAQGYAFGTLAEVNAFVESRGQTLPAEYPTVVGGYLQCTRCGTLFPGFPDGASARESFVKSQAYADETGSNWPGSSSPKIVYDCPVCSEKWCSNGSSSQDPQSYGILNQIKNASAETEAGSLKALPGQTVFVEVTVPAGAASGDIFSYYVSTADGCLRDRRDVVVADAGMVLNNNDLYLAQKTSLRAIRVPASATSLSFSVTSGADVIRITDISGYGCTLEAIGTGTASLLCKDQDGNTISTRTVTVKPPVLKCSQESVDLAADGTASTLAVSLCDDSGVELAMDASLRSEIIVPNLSVSITGDAGGNLDGGLVSGNSGSLARFIVSACVKGWNGLNLNGNGTWLKTGLGLKVTLANPSGNLSKTASLRIRNPFKGWPASPYSKALYYQRPDFSIREEGACHPMGLVDVSTGSQLIAPGARYDISAYGFRKVDGQMVHTASGSVLSQETSASCRLDIVFPEGTPSLLCIPETELPVSVPGTLDLSHTETNCYSGESKTRYLARFLVSERIEPIVRFEHEKWRFFLGMGYHRYRVYLDFGIIGAGLPFAAADAFDCTTDGASLSPVGDYPSWRYYDAQNHLVTTSSTEAESKGAVKGLAGEEVSRLDALSYRLDIDQELQAHKYWWSVLDFFEWNAANLLFHRKGQPSVHAFDLYYSSSGTATSSTPSSAAVYWLHYAQKYASEGFTNKEIWGD